MDIYLKIISLLPIISLLLLSLTLCFIIYRTKTKKVKPFNKVSEDIVILIPISLFFTFFLISIFTFGSGQSTLDRLEINSITFQSVLLIISTEAYMISFLTMFLFVPVFIVTLFVYLVLYSMRNSKEKKKFEDSGFQSLLLIIAISIIILISCVVLTIIMPPFS